MIVAGVPVYGEVKAYTVDSVSDINDLPAFDKERGNGGSTALVIGSGEVYVLGSDGWRQV